MHKQGGNFASGNKKELLKTTKQQGFRHKTKRNHIKDFDTRLARDQMKRLWFYPMHLGPFIFATRSEAKKVSFGPPQNQGRFAIFAFFYLGPCCHNFEHDVTASETTSGPVLFTSLIFEQKCELWNKKCVFHKSFWKSDGPDPKRWRPRGGEIQATA